MFSDCIVWHIGNTVHAVDAEICKQFLPRVAHRYFVVQHQCDFRQILTDHAGADNEQLESRAIGMGQGLCFFIPL